MNSINISSHYYLNKNLEKSVSVSSFTRPIKVAYIVPHAESEENHWILDGIFYKSYTWWAGTNTLIIPSNKDKFLNEEYEDWLQFYDADFIYSYIDLDQELIGKIDRLFCPIAFIRHNFWTDNWRGAIPDWRQWIEPVSSISTICSPYNRLNRQSVKGESIIPTLITQHKEPSDERFIADNFGTSWERPHIDCDNNSLFETLCLVPQNIFDSQKGKTFPVRYGTNYTSSSLEVFSKISKGNAITVSKLATIHDNNISRIKSYQLSNSFNIIVGGSCIDRINFWNLRNLTRKANGGAEHNVLIITSTMFDNYEFIKVLGEYLNNNNRTGRCGSKVALRSLSINKEQLEYIKTMLKENTYNQLYVPEDYKLPATPTKEDIKNNVYSTKDVNNFRLNEKINNLEAKEPEHFIYTPSRFHYLNEGQWAVDLKIDRHNNFSRSINVIDTWMLPRRRNVTQCFTSNLSKVSKNNLLAIIPVASNAIFQFEKVHKKLKYKLVLPEDKEVFHCLVQRNFKGFLSEKDMRLIGDQPPYERRELHLSDKGQNLRGVISMFNDLSEAYECLTNKFWREVLAKYEEEEVLTCNQIFGLLPNDENYKTRVEKERIIDKTLICKYLKANFLDALEYLVEKNIFYQVHQWRCAYCGHKNTRNIDEIKKQNSCEICRTIYYTPIDLEWKYKLNRFVFDSLHTRSGLVVLWAIGYLLTKNYKNNRTSFYFLPEVDLFYNEKRKEELDILCVLNGKFIFGEAKKSSMQFTESETETQKLIKKINSLMPDKVLLAFEQYSQNNEESALAKEKLDSTLQKIKTHIPKHISIKVIIAEKDPDFFDYPSEIPFDGIRTEEILDIREKNFKNKKPPDPLYTVDKDDENI